MKIASNVLHHHTHRTKKKNWKEKKHIKMSLYGMAEWNMRNFKIYFLSYNVSLALIHYSPSESIKLLCLRIHIVYTAPGTCLYISKQFFWFFCFRVSPFINFIFIYFTSFSTSQDDIYSMCLLIL